MDNDGQLEQFRAWIQICRDNKLQRAKMGDFEAQFAPPESANQPPGGMTDEEKHAYDQDTMYGATGLVPINLRAEREKSRGH